MDINELKKIVIKIRKYKRLITELNQFIPEISGDKSIDRVKDSIDTINALIGKLERSTIFDCEDCHSQVVKGKCSGCKRYYLTTK